MESTEQATPEQERVYTPEELQARKEQIKAYYLEQIKYLKVEKNYQELVTDIAELRMREIRAQIMIANALAPPPEPTPEPAPIPEGQNMGSSFPPDPVEVRVVPEHEINQRKLKKTEHAQ